MKALGYGSLTQTLYVYQLLTSSFIFFRILGSISKITYPHISTVILRYTLSDLMEYFGVNTFLKNCENFILPYQYRMQFMLVCIGVKFHKKLFSSIDVTLKWNYYIKNRSINQQNFYRVWIINRYITRLVHFLWPQS